MVAAVVVFGVIVVVVAGTVARTVDVMVAGAVVAAASSALSLHAGNRNTTTVRGINQRGGQSAQHRRTSQCCRHLTGDGVRLLRPSVSLST
jgi:hypothetical protein